MNFLRTYLLVAATTLLIACESNQTAQPAPQTEADRQANELFDAFFADWVARSPNFQTSLGIKDDYDKWDDLSEAHWQKRYQSNQQQLAQLKQLDPNALSSQVRLSYQLMEQALQLDNQTYQWRYHNYPVNQMFGWHTTVPSVLINQHSVSDVKDAEDYISRIRNVETLFTQLNQGLNVRAEKGIMLPKFLFPAVIESSQNIIKGAPFDDAPTSPILKDFQQKVGELQVPEAQKRALIRDAEEALLTYLMPAYKSLIANLQTLEKQADNKSGAWKFPNGDSFYTFALNKTTTTDLSAAEIHELGLQEVARIHQQMLAIVDKVGFQGDLQAFFKFIKTDSQFYYPNTDSGREQYLERTQAVIDAFTAKLDEAFITKPKSPLRVKRVEAFREKSAGKAFYQSPPPDGSRPGIYYANLYDMQDMPKYQLEALVYHEGLPGHHLQLSIAAELTDLPRFRKHGNYTAYIEGWGLYSEYLPKEMGFYQDPYSDFGRLAMELWRACRLVTDTGLHAKKWTRDEAIEYLQQNTPNSDNSIRSAIDRYIVLPSQATAYKIGMMKILELREKAKTQLGSGFSIRQYHETVLRNGAMPLDALEDIVNEWIADQADR